MGEEPLHLVDLRRCHVRRLELRDHQLVHRKLHGIDHGNAGDRSRAFGDQRSKRAAFAVPHDENGACPQPRRRSEKA